MVHRIHRVEIEIEVGEVALGEALIERLSLLRERRIAPLLDRVCSELSGPERLDRIDTLELELGPIPAGEFDDEFIRKLEAALRSQLARLLGESRSADERERASFELLEIYARTGNLPWWADRRDRAPIAHTLRFVLERAPASWIALLGSLVEDSLGLTRLARHCDDALIEAIVDRVGGEAELLADVRELERVMASVDGELESSRTQTLRVRVALLAALGRGARGADVLPGLVLELAANRPGVLLELGRPSLWASSSTRLREAIELLTPHSGRGSGTKIMSVRESLRSREGEGEGEQDRTSETNDEIEAPRVLTDPRAPQASDPPESEHGSPARPHSLRRPRPDPPTSPEPPTLIARRQRALDQLDTLDVEDAGLVILWPFLDRFFAHVGLLDLDRRFLDEPARMQAIALLSQLAFEDADPPEYRLPLAKLLCGCAPEAFFKLERPLAPEQIDECDRLLAAVIANAPILRDTSIASFRATFVQRPALLGIREGGWLLEVEQRAHDLVLERLPWSWSWVKLPWMFDPLSVRW